MTDARSPGFSIAGLAVAVVTVGVGTAAGLAFVPYVGAYVGTLLGGFVAGLVLEERPLLEAGVAAVLAVLGTLVAGTLIGTGVVPAVRALAAIDPATLLTSVVLSFAIGAFGAHFGDDLREGLTDPVEEPASRTPPGAAGGAPSPTGASEDDLTDAERTPDDRAAPERAGDDAVDRRSEPTDATEPASEEADLELDRER